MTDQLFKIREVVGLVLLLFLFNTANAQFGLNNTEFKNRISFDVKLNTSRFLPMQQNNTGQDWLQTKAALGGYFGAGINFHTGNFLLSSGAEYGFYNTGIKFDFLANDQNASTNQYVFKYNISDFQKSLYLNVKYILKEQNKWQKFTPIIGLGVKYNRVPYTNLKLGYAVFNNDSTQVNFEYTENTPNTNSNLFDYFSYQASIGFLEITKRKNLVQLNIVYNFSFTTLSTGEYNFDGFEKESFGSTTFNGSYIGLEFTLGLRPWKR